MKYIRTCKPLLTEPDDIDIYALSLAETSFLEAWQYQRSFSENDETRPRVLRKLLNWTLSRKNLALKNHAIFLTNEISQTSLCSSQDSRRVPFLSVRTVICPRLRFEPANRDPRPFNTRDPRSCLHTSHP